jgi:hypothetical protein
MTSTYKYSDMTSVEKAFFDYHRGQRQDLVRNPVFRDMTLSWRQKRNLVKYGPPRPEVEFCWNCGKSQHIIPASTPAGPRWRCKNCGMWVF